MTIQIYQDEREFCVWAEPEPGDKHLGVCVGIGATREEALCDALSNLLDGAKQVQALETKP